MNNQPELSIIIVNYNSGNYLYETIRSVYDAALEVEHEIIVVDNNSSDASLVRVIEDFPDLLLIKLDSNAGFARANNIGADKASADHLLFLNNDTKVLRGSVKILLDEIKEHPEYGSLSPQLLYDDHSLQLNYGNDPDIFSEFITKNFSNILFGLETKWRGTKFEKDADWVSGACFLIRTDLYKKLGGFDEHFFLYYEDADLGKRIRSMGFRNHITSKSKIIHFLGKSTTSVFNDILPRIKTGHLYYYRKHNSAFSLSLLRGYLLFRFRLKRIMAIISGNKNKLNVFDKTIKSIKEFK